MSITRIVSYARRPVPVPLPAALSPTAVRSGERSSAKRGFAVVAVCAALLAGAAPAIASAHHIFTVAGTGVVGTANNGDPAASSELNHPRGLAAWPDGGYLIADAFANRVYRVFPDGTIATVAGTGVQGFSGDGGPATEAELDFPHAVAPLGDGSFLISDANNFRIRRVAPDGTISTVAGTGVRGFSGDNGPAIDAKISAPRGIVATSDGGYLIADSDNNRVRSVSAHGIITTVAGDGVRGFNGDGVATSAELSLPFGVATLPGGGFLVADPGNERIRRVRHGRITTIAGNGIKGFAGDGHAATAAELNSPHNAIALSDGSILIADTFNDRVRRVWPSGIITTDAGNGTAGYSGDGGPAQHAELNQPKALLALWSGYLVADAANSVIRYVGGSPPAGAARR